VKGLDGVRHPRPGFYKTRGARGKHPSGTPMVVKHEEKNFDRCWGGGGVKPGRNEDAGDSKRRCHSVNKRGFRET